MKKLPLTMIMGGLSIILILMASACAPVEEVAARERGFCDTVADTYGLDPLDYPEWALDCVETGTRMRLAQRGALVGQVANVAAVGALQ